MHIWNVVTIRTNHWFHNTDQIAAKLTELEESEWEIFTVTVDRGYATIVSRKPR